MTRSVLFTAARVCVLVLATVHAPARADSALRVALTNDDGWNAAGIAALHEEFTRRGMAVTRVGPSTQQSGSSAALNTGAITIRRHSERVYSAAVDTDAGAEPLTAGLLAIDLANRLDGAPPQWLVSGINQGANLGSAAPHSGTVGAVIGSLSGSFGEPVAGLAISTDEPRCNPECVAAHYSRVARFVADLLERLDQPLPGGVGLNINYPALPAYDIKGIRVSRQGAGFPVNGVPLRLTYHCADCTSLNDGETAKASLQPTPLPVHTDGAGDTDAYAAGYITVVPIEGDYTANQYSSLNRQLNRVLKGLTISPAP